MSSQPPAHSSNPLGTSGDLRSRIFRHHLPLAPGERLRRIGLMSSLRASPMFSLVVLVSLALYGLIGLMVLVMQFQPGFMGMAHGTQPHHRVHDLTFALLLAPGGLGLLAQLRTPSRNVAGQFMALAPWIGLLLAFSLATSWLVFAPAPILGALTLAATILHPARRDFSRSFSIARFNRVMLALVIIAAVPLLAWAFTNIALQRTLDNDHAALGHYGFMAAFGITVLCLAALASVRPAGWRLTAWTAGILPSALGLLSLLYPTNDSSLSWRWALAAIAWGIAFVAVASLTGKKNGDPDNHAIDASTREIAGVPRLSKVFAVVVILLGALLVAMHLAGGGPGRHSP